MRTTHPQHSPFELKCGYNKDEQSRNDARKTCVETMHEINSTPWQEYDIRSFTTECLQRSVFQRPGNLEVCDTETAQRTGDVQ